MQMSKGELSKFKKINFCLKFLKNPLQFIALFEKSENLCDFSNFNNLFLGDNKMKPSQRMRMRNSNASKAVTTFIDSCIEETFSKLCNITSEEVNK